MTSFDGELKRKIIGADAAASRVKSGDWVEYGFGLGQPDLFDRALAERVASLERVKIRGCLAMRPRATIEADHDARKRREKVGGKVLVDIFTNEKFVDVIGVSKGRGFAGVVKRHHFGGGPGAHGHMFQVQGLAPAFSGMMHSLPLQHGEII